MEITPRSQQTKRALPRTYLRAVKRIRNADIITNSKNLNCKRMKIYQDALLMMDRIKNNGSEEMHNV